MENNIHSCVSTFGPPWHRHFLLGGPPGCHIRSFPPPLHTFPPFLWRPPAKGGGQRRWRLFYTLLWDAADYVLVSFSFCELPRKIHHSAPASPCHWWHLVMKREKDNKEINTTKCRCNLILHITQKPMFCYRIASYRSDHQQTGHCSEGSGKCSEGQLSEKIEIFILRWFDLNRKLSNTK